MTSIYLAGRWSQQAELRSVREEIERLGYKVVSSWLDEEGLYLPANPQASRAYALADMRDLKKADLLILDTRFPLAPDGGGGREFEHGFATYKGIAVWRVGPVRGIFHVLVDVEFDCWPKVFKALGERA